MQQSNRTILDAGYQLQTIDKGGEMVEHIVLIKIKPSTSQKQIQEATEALLRMKGEIPGIEDISAGVNSSPEGKNQGYDYGLVVRFRDANTRDEYITHPYHNKIASEYVVPIIEDVLVLDYDH